MKIAIIKIQKWGLGAVSYTHLDVYKRQWQGCANFVSDHITYVPLNNPLSLVSQVTVFFPFVISLLLLTINNFSDAIDGRKRITS